MKNLLIPALAIAVASAALPAAAQSYDRPSHSSPSYGNQSHNRPTPSYGPSYGQNQGGWQSINERKYNLDRRIDQGVRTRQLSNREASRLKDELNSLVRLERQYQRDGLNRRERTELDRRYDSLSAKVRYERNDNNGRRH